MQWGFGLRYEWKVVVEAMRVGFTGDRNRSLDESNVEVWFSVLGRSPFILMKPTHCLLRLPARTVTEGCLWSSRHSFAKVRTWTRAATVGCYGQGPFFHLVSKEIGLRADTPQRHTHKHKHSLLLSITDRSYVTLYLFFDRTMLLYTDVRPC